MAIHLLVSIPGAADYAWSHPGNSIAIGRDSSCDLVIAGHGVTSVSGQHARIEVRDRDRLFLQDLGSTNGTYVNGQKIHGRTPLREGDEITLGALGPRLTVGVRAAPKSAPREPVVATTVIEAMPVMKSAPMPVRQEAAKPWQPPPLPAYSPPLPASQSDPRQSSSGSVRKSPPRSKGILIGLGAMMVCLVAIVIATVAFSGRAGEDKKNSDGKSDGKTERLVMTDVHQDADIQQSLGMVVCGTKLRRTRDGAVLEEAWGSGSCFAVTRKGHLLTNWHVIDPYKKFAQNQQRGVSRQITYEGALYDVIPQIWIYFGTNRYEGKILYDDNDRDFAILQIDREHAPFFAISDKVEQKKLTPVIAGGYPSVANQALAREMETKAISPVTRIKQKAEDYYPKRAFESVLTKGEISRSFTDELNRKWLQHTAAIAHGNSGGCLVTDDATVVGINTEVAIQKKSGTIAPNVGFSVPIGNYKAEIDKLCPGVVWR